MVVQFHAVLTSTPVGDEWTVSFASRFNGIKRVRRTHRMANDGTQRQSGRSGAGKNLSPIGNVTPSCRSSRSYTVTMSASMLQRVFASDDNVIGSASRLLHTSRSLPRQQMTPLLPHSWVTFLV